MDSTPTLRAATDATALVATPPPNETLLGGRPMTTDEEVAVAGMLLLARSGLGVEGVPVGPVPALGPVASHVRNFLCCFPFKCISAWLT
jgi:hypothetical protein